MSIAFTSCGGNAPLAVCTPASFLCHCPVRPGATINSSAVLAAIRTLQVWLKFAIHHEGRISLARFRRFISEGPLTR